LLVSSGGAAAATGASVLAFKDDVKKSYEAAERSGRVVATLTVCVNDYRTTLNARDKVEDEKQRNRLLSDCHKRCAERTLQVLEQNGGIFIKMGQHLVSTRHPAPRLSMPL
jgi:aarF domain-containing kinase